MGFLKCLSVCSESGGAAGMQAQEVNCVRLQLDQKWKPAGSLSDSTQLCSYILSTGLIFFASFLSLNTLHAGTAEARPYLGWGELPSYIHWSRLD